MTLKFTIRIAFIFNTLFLHSQFADSRRNNFATNGKEDFYSYFIREAPKHPGDYNAPHAAKDIPWLNMNLLDRSASFVKNNFLGVSMAHMYSLIEVFSLKTGSSVLLTTEQFGNTTLAYKRLLRTMIHVREWNLAGSNILNSHSNASKSLQSIRRRHKSAAYVSKRRRQSQTHGIRPVAATKDNWELMEALKADLAHVDTTESPVFLQDWFSTTPVGQFDMGVVQFLFFGHQMMSPQCFGIFRSSFEDRKAFIHHWAVVGRILGIEDRFNVALNLPLSMYRIFYKNIVIASLKTIDVRLIAIMSNTMDGLSKNYLVPTAMRLKCWLYASLKNTVEDFEGRNILKLMNAKDRICLRYYRFLTGPTNKSKLYGGVSTLTFNTWIRQQSEKHKINEFR